MALDNINVTKNNPTYAWTTTASNSTTGWSPSAGDTEDLTVTASATSSHVGDYTLTVTDGNSCFNSDVVTVGSCTEVTAAGSIASAQSNCGTFDPAAFTDGGAPNGSGGTLTYVWQTSSDDASWSDIGSSDAATYDPGSTSSDTYFRRGAYRCGSGGIQYTTSLLVDIVATPNAGTVSGNSALNVGSSVTLTSNGDGSGVWSSGNTSAATINSSTGAVAAVAIGTAVMTYTKSASPCSDATATITIQVTNDFISTASPTNWSSTSSWGGGVVPANINGVAPDVQITGNLTVDVSTATITTLTVDASKTLTVSAGNTVTVSGATDVNGTISVAGIYDANGSYDATGGNTTLTGTGRLQLGGTVTSLGTDNLASTSTVEYDGSSAQTIDPLSSKAAYGNVEISGGLKNMSGETTVSNLLTWGADADVATNGQILNLTGGQPVSFGTTNPYVWGNVDNDRVIYKGTGGTGYVTVKYTSTSTDEFYIPVGADGSQRIIAITPSSATSTVWTVEYIESTPYNSGTLTWNTHPTGSPIESGSGIANVNNDYYYNISRTGTATATLKIGMVGLSQTPASNGETHLIHWDSGDNHWEKLTSTRGGATEANRYVQATNVSNFSPFGQGSGGAALPIDLLSFDAKCEEGEVGLTFDVASQINNDYYTIERSVDNKNWSIVTEIAGVEGGNTSTEMSYRWTDYNPLRGMSYYRLTQTDFDGRSEIFAPITAACRDQEIGDYSVYPNPAKEQLMIDLELDDYQGENLKVRLMDINGKVAMEEPITLERGFNHLEMNISELPDGVYLLQFTGTKSHIKESRVVKK
jgi:hypothetical protein